MPRVPVADFVGGFDQLQYRQINASGLWNGLLERTGRSAPDDFQMRKGPGVEPFLVVPAAVSVRGLFQQDSRAFVVAGSTFAEFDASGNLFHNLTVTEDSNPATMVCNGQNGLAGGTAEQPVTSITSSGTLATVTTTGAHGFGTDWRVVISGATETEYNGIFTITVTGANTFTYVFAGSTTSPATGMITAMGAQGGPQLLVMSGGTGIVFDMVTNTSAPITAPALSLPYSLAIYIDGYGVVLKKDSPQFNFSNLNDFTVFDALDFASRSEGSDNIVSMVRNHREIWLLGSLTTEVWQDVSQGNTIFAPIQGVFIEAGCIATYSALSVDNTVFWLGQSVQGHGLVFRANGYTPERISTPSIEFQLAQSTRLSETIGFSFQLESHTVYGLYVPDLPYTFIFDISTGRWSVFARWTAFGEWIPWFARCSCHAFGKTLVGDRSSGTIYEVSFDFLDNLLVTV